MGIESFRYDGKTVLVIGGATGMGAATAQVVSELGGAVTVMDVAEVGFPVKEAIRVDLRERKAVERAVGGLAGPLHAVFCCAGVADGTPGLMLINFIAQRHVLDLLLAKDALPRGAAIAMVSSVAGLAWLQKLGTLREFLDVSDWEGAAKWISQHEGTDSYMFSKEAINAYVARQAFPLLRRGIRINAIEPGPTDTPLARANEEIWLGYARAYNQAAGVDFLNPRQMAEVLAFLCSPAASGINGTSFLVDQGQIPSGISGTFGKAFGS
jgi:NAD(P)-dependent dehydrogenase (short-subunit alcohol dehydrogenase family)